MYKAVYYIIPVIFFFSSLLRAQENNMRQQAGSELVERNFPEIIYGTASYYSNRFQNRKTASGEIFDQKKKTAACNVLPLGTWIRVTNLRNKRTVVVKVNDRLHGKMRRVVDLSREAAGELGFLRSGITKVKVEVLGKKKPTP